MGPADAACAGVEEEIDALPRAYDLPPDLVTCFVLRFPVRASPDVRFRLLLAGLSAQGEPIPPLELRYLRFSGNAVD